MKLVVTVVGKDRVGIIAMVSQILAENNVNILNINQNIMEGFFNMVMIAEMSEDSKLKLGELQKVLKDKGAQSVRACATHGLLSGSAISRIHDSQLEEVFITDSIPHPELANDPKIRIVSMTEVFAKIIHKVYNYESISSDFIF